MEEAEKKRQAMLQANKKEAEVKRNFVIQKKTAAAGGAVAASVDSTGNVVFGRGDMLKTKEQLAEEKKVALSIRVKPLNIEGLSVDELKKKANELWEQIIQLESDKYDLEERSKRQDYDVSKSRVTY